MPSMGNRLAVCEARLSGLWEKMVRTIGIYTVNVLLVEGYTLSVDRAGSAIGGWMRSREAGSTQAARP